MVYTELAQKRQHFTWHQRTWHFTWHQRTKERYQYTTSVDINNTHCKTIQSLIQNHTRHARSESAREQRIAIYKS